MSPDIEKARERISRYSNQTKLKATLEASLQWLPDGGKEALASDILNATTVHKLHEIFFNILTILAWPAILQSEASQVRTPQEQLSPLGNYQQGTQEDCLKRDGSCCVVTGAMDVETYSEKGRPEGFESTHVQVAHIMPYFISYWNKSAMTTVWETLCRYFPAIHQARMGAGGINALVNSLSNSFLLNFSLNLVFSRFALAFKATDRPNIYKTVRFSGFPTSLLIGFPNEIELKPVAAPGSEHLELPSKNLLDCHYRLAQILNACGDKMAFLPGKYRNHWEYHIRWNVQAMLDGDADLSGYLETALWWA
ncbi:similar to An03g03340 [Aspergillus niger]|uniref:Similar to An03g03340 n=1 Tax=Aspergillus niger TaxID=5061 RepID=A0A100IGQ4_ASPNG|nr:similar to An03g03340 [Aspergillus niger]